MQLFGLKIMTLNEYKSILNRIVKLEYQMDVILNKKTYSNNSL